MRTTDTAAAFADTELASNVTLFPMDLVGNDRPRPAILRPPAVLAHPLHDTRSEPSRAAPRLTAAELEYIHRLEAQAAAADAARDRQTHAVAAAWRNGQDAGLTDGFREGFKSSALWHGIVGAFYALLAVALIVVGLVMLGAHVSKLW
jgi:hypothetical protein